ncbi:MAG TPA: hypothetical protein VHX36_13625 [Candidatus Acidoferrales bacterium]|jgi:hypothetical protein|nr:hypothetical protein [Candidatus Acidoferrales bacterium]
MSPRPSLLLSAALCAAVGTSLFAAPGARADELKLKDGTKISGTIVGFEQNSFKVKTSYGFAEVQKEQVVSISITAAKTESSAAPAAEAAKPETANAAPVISKPAIKPAPAAKPVSAPNVAAASPSPIAAAPVADPAPPKPAAPVPIREEVVGNLYTNDTYRFHMYKPPDWQMIAGARKLLPGTITALGTDDETTYLLIGQEPAGESLTSDITATEQRLRDVMDNFRPLAEEHISIGGVPAIEHHFRGGVDDHDWSGVAVFIPRGARVYTIFGMTRADNDLVQIQENVIDRAISSLQFTQQ